MRTGWRRIMIAGLAALLPALPASADPALDARLADALKDGGFAADVAAFRAVGDMSPDAKAALGALSAFAAVEGLARGYYRHGFRSPRQSGVPLFRMPLPENPQAEPLSYETFRGVLSRFVEDLDTAGARLREAAENDFKITVDLAAIQFDLSPDGGAGPRQSFLAILLPSQGLPDAPPAGGWTFRFDRADAFWLAGYCELLASVGDFLLAHDFSEMFDAGFHHVFTGAETPVTKAAPAGGTDLLGFDTSFADGIAALHLMHWPVVEPERRARVAERLLRAVAESRRTFDAALAETDDDREWLPAPRQTQWSSTTPVTDVQIAAWRGVLDDGEAALKGRLLVPHWRFEKGIDLAAFFARPTTPFDPWLLYTGHGAVPYLAEGPILDAQRWNDLTTPFGGRFALYALFFN